MSDEEFPPILFRYCKIDSFTKNIFAQNQIFFSSPDRFNDPFDSKIMLNFEGTEEQWKDCLLDICKKHYPKVCNSEIEVYVNEIIANKIYKSIPKKLGFSFLEQMGVFIVCRSVGIIFLCGHIMLIFIAEFVWDLTQITKCLARHSKLSTRKIIRKLSFF